MAFEKINLFTNEIYTKHLELEQKINDAECSNEKRASLYVEQRVLFDCLLVYYNTTLQTSKFGSQRIHCRSILEAINPAFCKGYFAPTRKTKKLTNGNN